MPELEWLEAARADLLAIVDYISDDNPDAAQRLKDDIEAKTAELPEFPSFTGQAGLKTQGKWSSGRTTSWCTRKTPSPCAYCTLRSSGRQQRMS